MRVPVRPLVLALVTGALMFPGNLSAQSAPRTITTQDLAQAKNGGSDWITHGGALNNQRYSTLNQINTAKVSQLKGVWMTRLGSGRGSKYRFEADPLVVDGVMYIPTGNDDIFALDAKTGRKIWEWDSDIPQVNDLICCGWDNRGVAVGDGKVYSGLLDGSFVALDQKTGKIAWRTQLEDYKDGYSLTGAYRYYDGLVFMGISGADNGIRGRVTALDAKDGHEVWRFYTVAGPSEIGGDSWPSTSADSEQAQAYPIYGGLPFDGTMYTCEYNFTPQVVSVPVGTTLTWQNDGSVIHTATAADGSWDTGDIAGGGGTASVTFDTAGTYTFNCTPHPWMIGRVIVG